LAIIDIDNFKSVNDNFGHLYGDEILIQLAQIIRSSFRDEDLKFRFGGEEFVILLKASSIEACKHTLERFRQNVASQDFPTVGQVTVSIGSVQFTQDQF
jgi:diguanylate cyclase (GGDEF)-like protein